MVIADLKAQLEKSRRELYHILDMMPEDKMEFRPGGQAKSAAGILQHLAGCEAWVMELAQKGTAPFPPPDPGIDCTDKADLKRCLDGIRSQTLKGLDTMSQERLAEVQKMPWGEEMSVRDLLGFIPQHDVWHAGQIAYIQTILGIMDF